MLALASVFSSLDENTTYVVQKTFEGNWIKTWSTLKPKNGSGHRVQEHVFGEVIIVFGSASLQLVHCDNAHPGMYLAVLVNSEVCWLHESWMSQCKFVKV